MKVTEKKFNRIRAINVKTNGGLMQKEIARYTGLSEATISHVLRAKSFQEYKDLICKKKPVSFSEEETKDINEFEEKYTKKDKLQNIEALLWAILNELKVRTIK